MNRPQDIFHPRQSIIHLCYLIFTHAFSFICICLIAPLFFDSIFLLFVVTSFLSYLFHDQKIISLCYVQKTEWILKFGHDEMMHATLLPSSVMMRYFVVLHFNCIHSAKKKRMVLFSDHFSKADYQALRRCMKNGY